MTSVSSVAVGPPANVSHGPKSAQEPQSQQIAKPVDKLKADDGGPAFTSPITSVDPKSGIAIQVYRERLMPLTH